MPIGYVIGLVIVGLFTIAALAPPQRPRKLALAAFAIGVAPSEIPQVFGLMLLASTGLALAEGDLTGANAVLLAPAGLVIAGLVVVAVRGMRAPAAVDRGLVEAGIPPVSHGPWWRGLVAPFPVRPRSVERIADIGYGEHRRQRLDVYRSRKAHEPGPVLVYLHGGGYFSGNKHREGRALLHHLAERGWLCVSATYRLRPEVGFEGHLHDAKRVLAWAHSHASDYDGYGDSAARPLVMAGSSAGAHLTSICALTQDDARLQPGFEEASTAVDAGICLSGYYGRYYGRGPDEPVASTPFALNPADAPLMLVVHGGLDSYAPASTARDLASSLREHSPGPVLHIEFPGGQHSFELMRSWRTRALLDAVDAFVGALKLR